MPSSVLQAPLDDLSRLLHHLISFLSDMIRIRENAEYYDKLDVPYHAPLSHEQTARGRKRYKDSNFSMEGKGKWSAGLGSSSIFVDV